MEFGARIKQLREAAAFSQNELAKRAGIAQSGLSYLENGAKSPNIDTLLRICHALGITLAEFMGESGAPQLDSDLRQLLREAETLDPEQRSKLTDFVRSFQGSEDIRELSHAIADRLIYLCDERGITINKLATLAGLTQSTVDSIAKGKSRNPKLTTLWKISRALGITIDEFLDAPAFKDLI